MNFGLYIKVLNLDYPGLLLQMQKKAARGEKRSTARKKEKKRKKQQHENKLEAASQSHTVMDKKVYTHLHTHTHITILYSVFFFFFLLRLIIFHAVCSAYLLFVNIHTVFCTGTFFFSLSIGVWPDCLS